MPEPGWYYRLSDFFKEKVGCKVYKIPLDAGFTCPNRDGTISFGGCIYCYNPSFSPPALRWEKKDPKNHIREQLLTYMEKLKGQGIPDVPGGRYLAYFQSYTNTYGDLQDMKELYEEALNTPGILGLSIATRPDCLSPEVLELLTAYARDYHIWLEVGLQSSHDRTLQLINRGHDYACFRDAVLRCRNRGIYVCAHIIDGLPGETAMDMLETVKKVNELPLQGIKFHQLQIHKATPLYPMYERGEVKVLVLEEYLDILCRQLEVLREDIAVHRLLGDVTHQDLLVAPRWRVHARNFTQRVEAELRKRNTWQGRKTSAKKGNR